MGGRGTGVDMVAEQVARPETWYSAASCAGYPRRVELLLVSGFYSTRSCKGGSSGGGLHGAGSVICDVSGGTPDFQLSGPIRRALTPKTCAGKREIASVVRVLRWNPSGRLEMKIAINCGCRVWAGQVW